MKKTVGGTRELGFTLAELLVASVVMTTALLGIGALFEQAMRVEGRTSVCWSDRAAAEAALSDIAEAVESAINLPDIPALVVSSESNGDGSLICQVDLQRRRYQWRQDESTRTWSLQLQTMVFGGTRNLTLDAVPESPDKKELWDEIQQERIAAHLKHISVGIKPLGDPSANWKRRWKGPVGDVAVRIRVVVGDESVERIIVPRANANFVG